MAQSSDVDKRLSRFQERLGYQFKDELLLIQALTHSSFGQPDNERLEFLGDAVLKFVLSDILYEQLPDYEEGNLTRGRVAFENNNQLAIVASALDIGPMIRLGKGARKDGVVENDSVLAGALEAVIAAIYLDGSLEDIVEFVNGHFKIVNSPEGSNRHHSFAGHADLAHPKTRLQELTIKQHKVYPTYSSEKRETKGKVLSWKVLCTVPGTSFSTDGESNSIQDAETEAAQKMLELLQT